MNQLVLKKKNELMKKKKGFTLVELIIVIAIIAILAAMAIPKFSEVRLDARVSNDIAAAKNIQSAASMLSANGTISTGTFEVGKTGDVSGIAIQDRIDGNSKPQAKSTFSFFVTVSADGSVVVKAGAAEASAITLAPATDDTSSKYRAEVKK